MCKGQSHETSRSICLAQRLFATSTNVQMVEYGDSKVMSEEDIWVEICPCKDIIKPTIVVKAEQLL